MFTAAESHTRIPATPPGSNKAASAEIKPFRRNKYDELYFSSGKGIVTGFAAPLKRSTFAPDENHKLPAVIAKIMNEGEDAIDARDVSYPFA